MLCAISGEQPVDPVVSPSSGAIFERKHIVNYLATSTTDPILNKPLAVKDLILIKPDPVFVPPKPTSLTSIPTLLATFQTEWDALALETFSLRKQLYNARQELSTALYQQDAAIRVAANAIKDRDEARAALEQLTALVLNPAAVAAQIPVDAITNARDELFQLHKSIKPTYSVKPEQTLELELESSEETLISPVSTACYGADLRQVVLGSSLGKVADVTNEVVFDIESSVTAVAIAQDGYIAAGANALYYYTDNTVHELPGSLAGVRLLAVHPLIGSLFVAVSERSWAICDLTMPLLRSDDAGFGTLCADVHVDGAIFAVGTDASKVAIHSFTDGTLLSDTAVLNESVTQVKFALNGYWLLVASSSDTSSAIDVVDLRKNTVAHTLRFDLPGVKFAVDPSSSVVATYCGNSVSLHRYIKKGKRWLENTASTIVEDGVDIQILQTYDDTQFVELNRLDVSVVARDGKRTTFNVSYV